MDKDLLLDTHINSASILGFWDETSKSSVIKSVEQIYSNEILMNYGISDLVIHNDKVLFKWYKRLIPLSSEELKDRYGR